MFTWGAFILIIIGICILLSFLVAGLKYLKRDRGKFISHTFKYSICSFSIAMIFYFLISLIMSPNIIGKTSIENEKFYYKGKEYIYSVKDITDSTSDLYGRFILGTGYIETNTTKKEYYYVLAGDDKEGYIKAKYNQSKTYLFFDEEEKPYTKVKRHKYDMVYEKNWLFGGLLKSIKPTTCYETVKRELHLPKNAIKMKYDIDLQ